MTVFTATCVQMRSGCDPVHNLRTATEFIRAAAAQGADYVQTPEMTTLMELDRASLFARIQGEQDDPAVAAFSELASDLGIWLHIGSLAIRVGECQAANRGFLFDPAGTLRARYDKIHMFDVDLPGGESYRESRTYRPGATAVVADLPWARLGVTICYDLRFPLLYRDLTQAGATVLAVPSAFTEKTGRAHWHTLLRARAIETNAWVIAAAQGGRHENGRATFGHSLIVAPCGEVVAEKSDAEPGLVMAPVDLAAAARTRVASLERDPVTCKVTCNQDN